MSKKTTATQTDIKNNAPSAESGKKLKVKRLTLGDIDQDVRGGCACQPDSVCPPPGD